MSADGEMVAFQDGPQFKLWNVTTGAVALLSRTTG